MNTISAEIIEKYYKKDSMAYKFLYEHSQSVAQLAVRIANQNPDLCPDIEMVRTAAMLHDIGIYMTNAPEIGCFGEHPYLAHGYLGRELLEKEGLHEIAPVCERHVGVGLTLEDIKNNKLPLPQRDMTPQTIEEKIVCYADKFYSKSDKYLKTPRPLDKTRKKVAKYGPEKIAVFEDLIKLFGSDYIF